ncbi:hypothetical protein [Rhodococcus artemisiae]|uniref:hypothetical protein n=1 Tax=Rhodococcus artemisiae TaxID=714159 RepID=UPI0038B50520
MRLLPDGTARDVAAALAQIAWRARTVAADAVSGLKFSAALPPGLAEQSLAERLGDDEGAHAVLEVPRTIRRRVE